jgi:hypothetical protein
MKISSIQMSEEFKGILRREKNKSESFEDYIKRLRNKSIDCSIEKKQSIDHSIEQSIDEENTKILKEDLVEEIPEKKQENNYEELNLEHENWDSSHICKKHGLPAQYDEIEKEWFCKLCNHKNFNSGIKVLGTEVRIREIEQPKIERIIPQSHLYEHH